MTTLWLSVRRRPRRSVAAFTACLLVVVFAACGDHPGNTIDPVTGDFGGHIQDLYRAVFWWTIAIWALVWTLLAYVLMRFKERPGSPEPKQTRGNLALEVGWTLGPAVIVVAISIPTIQAVFKTQARPTSAALEVEVIGHQWWWEYRYPGEGVVTANELHLPVGRQIHLVLSSADVTHSFWVPRIGGKRDVNPLVRQPEGQDSPRNYLTFTIDEPGVYSGQCAEFCGESHALMRLRVFAESREDFVLWVSQMQEPAQPDSGSLADRGREVFMRSVCIACHAIAGTNAAGVLGPDLTRVGARTQIGAGMLDTSAENLALWIADPGAVKPGAKMPGTNHPGGGMPATGLSQPDIEAIAAYLWSLK